MTDVLDEKQKRVKINNLLNGMAHKEKIIQNEGSDKKSKWVLKNR